MSQSSTSGSFRRIAIALSLLALFASCTPMSETVETTADNGTDADEALAAGEYCYASDRGEEAAYVRLSVNADSSVSGVLEHSFPPEGGDVSAAKIEVFGSVDGEELALDKEHFVEYDTVWTPTDSENGSSTWQATPALLSVDSETEQRINTAQLSQADCATVSAALSGSTDTNLPSQNSPGQTDNPVAVSDSLPAGVYCYAAEQGEYQTYASISVKADNSTESTIIHRFPPAGDSYETRVDAIGTADDVALSVYTIPFTKYDTAWLPLLNQSKNTVWTATPEALTVDADSSQRNGDTEFAAVDCDDIFESMYPLGGVYAGPFGTPGSRLLTGYDGVRIRPIQFEAGRFSATVADRVVRAFADLYILDARASQTMTLDMSSPEENAVFAVVSPQGEILAEEQTSAEIELPEDGFYKIAVAGTRANASYELYVGVD